MNDDLTKYPTYDELQAEEIQLVVRLGKVENAIKAMNEVSGITRSVTMREAYFGTSTSRPSLLLPLAPTPPLPMANLIPKNGFKDFNTHDGAVYLLKVKGKPLKTKEIYEEFERNGKHTTAKEPMVSLYNGLVGASERKDSQLVALGNGVWGLKGRDSNLFD